MSRASEAAELLGQDGCNWTRWAEATAGAHRSGGEPDAVVRVQFADGSALVDARGIFWDVVPPWCRGTCSEGAGCTQGRCIYQCECEECPDGRAEAEAEAKAEAARAEAEAADDRLKEAEAEEVAAWTAAGMEDSNNVPATPAGVSWRSAADAADAAESAADAAWAAWRSANAAWLAARRDN